MCDGVSGGEMNDFKLFGGFGNRRTDGRTFVLLESLSRLKNWPANSSALSHCALHSNVPCYLFQQK